MVNAVLALLITVGLLAMTPLPALTEATGALDRREYDVVERQYAAVIEHGREAERAVRQVRDRSNSEYYESLARGAVRLCLFILACVAAVRLGRLVDRAARPHRPEYDGTSTP